MPTKAFLDTRRGQLKSLFGNFRDRRLFWDSLVQRKENPVLDPKVTNIGYYQTPDLRDQENNLIDIMTMGPTRLSVAGSSTNTNAQKALRDLVLWVNRTWALMDNGRWVDQANSGGQARHGVKVMRLRHKPVTEPDDTDADAAEDAREAAFLSRGNVFSVDDADTLSCTWLERSRRTNCVIYETDIPYLDAYEEFRQEAEPATEDKPAKYEYPGLDPAGHLIWVGDDIPIDAGWATKTLRHTVIEWLDDTEECPCCDDEHYLYSGAEYLTGQGEDPSDDNELDTYTLPWRYAPSFRICGGRINWLDKDPDERYQPLNYSLMVEAAVINWCQTMLLTLANRDSADDRVYLSLAHLSDQAIGRLPEAFFESMSVPLPEEGSDSIAVLAGDLQKWPTEMAEALTQELDRAQARFEAAKVNRFLTGTAYKEMADGTGTMGLQQAQAAALPIKRPLNEQDMWIWELMSDILHAIKLWGYEQDSATEQRFYVTGAGMEDQMRGSTKPSETVFMSASKLAACGDYDLMVKTKNTTAAEEQATLQRAAFLYDRGDITYEQYLEMIGYADTDHQAALLNKEKIRRRNEPMIARTQDYALAVIYSELSGIPTEIIMGTPSPVVGPDGQPVTQQNAPTGGPALRRPLVDTPGQQPTIALPSIQSPSGGNNPGQQPPQ